MVFKSLPVIMAAVLVIIYIIIQFLWLGQSIWIPFIFAILIWNILGTMSRVLQNIPVIGIKIPRIVAVWVSFMLGVFVFIFMGRILTENLQEMIPSSQALQANFVKLVAKIPNFGMDIEYIKHLINQAIAQINFQQLLYGLYSSMTNLMSSLCLMVLFVMFFFWEELYFSQKMTKLFLTERSRTLAEQLLHQISFEIQRYLGLKTLFSTLTGCCLYVLFKCMGLEFAEFWGVVGFLLNFIPNFGPMFVTIVVSLFAYFQWLDWGYLGVFLGLQILIHVLIGNVLEPKYLGKAMHLSPLFILLSLSFWGALWGGIGLFLAVPMMVVMMIILRSFQATKFWAILMSENGNLVDETMS